jgi:phosphatidylinositol alpha-1,6-mannosyltransferase
VLHRWFPTVTYAHADELTHRPGITSRALTASDEVIAVSRYTAELCVQRGADPDCLHVVNPGFDLDVTASMSQRTPTPTLVTVARLTDRYKGFDVVTRALPSILKRVPSARWIVVGDGPLRSELERDIAKAGLRDAVEFRGRLSDAQRDAVLATAGVFVMPSRLPERGGGGEGFGIVYLEAAAAGVPVVAGNVAGALDAVDDGVTGLLVDPTDAAAVAKAVVAILTNPARAAAMGEAGRMWAQSFSWSRMAGDVDRILKLAIARRAASNPA